MKKLMTRIRGREVTPMRIICSKVREGLRKKYGARRAICSTKITTSPILAILEATASPNRKSSLRKAPPSASRKWTQADSEAFPGSETVIFRPPARVVDEGSVIGDEGQRHVA